MSGHYIYVMCPTCAESDSIYTGDQELDAFDDADWEGEFLEVFCRDCKNAEVA